MDPLSIIGLLLGAGQLATSIFGLTQDPYKNLPDPKNINPYTDDVYSMLMGQYDNLNNQFTSSLAGMQTAGAEDASRSRDALAALGGISTASQYDPMAASRAFFAQEPAFQGLLDRTLGTGETARGELDRLRAQMGEAAASRFGGSATSSAFRRDVLSASADPAFQYAAQRDAMRAQLGAQLMGQQMGQLGSAYQSQEQFRQAAAAQALQSLLGQAQGYGTLSQASQSQAAQQASLLGGLLGQTSGQLGQMGQAQFWSPNVVTNPNATSPQGAMNDAMDLVKFMNEMGIFGAS